MEASTIELNQKSKVTVIVTTYTKERASDLLECIDSLRKQTLKPEEILIVLDNPELGPFYSSVIPNEVKVLSSAGSWGSSYARNTGLRMAKGEIVAFIDDDATADKDWLRNLLSNYDTTDVVGVTGFVTPVWENGRPSWFPEELDWIVGCSYKGLPKWKSSVRNPIGCNMSFKKEIFDKAGYFDTRLGAQPSKLLMRSEEAELSLRIFKAYPRSRIIYDPSAIVYHKVPRSRKSIRYLAKRSFHEGLSKRMFETSAQTSGVLTVENQYLRYLLRTAMLSRLKRILLPNNVPQFLVLLLGMSLVGIGYCTGNLTPHFSREKT